MKEQPKVGRPCLDFATRIEQQEIPWGTCGQPYWIYYQAGEVLGSAAEAAVIQSQEEDPPQQKVFTTRVSSEEASGREKRRQEKLKETIGDLNLPDGERETLMSFLLTYHNTFCLDEGERGETAWRLTPEPLTH